MNGNPINVIILFVFSSFGQQNLIKSTLANDQIVKFLYVCAREHRDMHSILISVNNSSKFFQVLIGQFNIQHLL